MLIINADDFGRDPSVNKAVAEAFRKGLCSSATLMATEAGFEEACDLIRSGRLDGHIGLHLVLRNGMPLTGPIRRLPRFCDREGRLRLIRWGPVPLLRFSGEERRALAEEVRAQIARCRAGGVRLTHMDSHYHIHTEWAVAGVVLEVARQEKIPYIRIARNCGPHLNPAKRFYKALLNAKFRRAGVARTRHFGSIPDYAALKRSDSFELMVHPRIGPSGEVVDEVGPEPLEAVMQRVQDYRTAVSFSGKRL